VLSTGTGIVPGLDFTLAPGDVVDVTVAEVGTLSNPVVPVAVARARAAAAR
jgi:2-dehydro-3-deoxy-D-arabinonate dehydratase